MKIANLILVTALAGCTTVNEEGTLSATKNADGTGKSEPSPNETYNPIQSLCGKKLNFKRVYPDPDDIFTKSEHSWLSRKSTMNYDYYKYRSNNPDGTYEINTIAISSEAIRIMEEKNITCDEAVYKFGRMKGKPSGAIKLKIPGIGASEYSEIDIGLHDTTHPTFFEPASVTVLEAADNSSYFHILMFHKAKRYYQPEDIRRYTTIIIDLDRHDSVYHAINKKVVRQDFDDQWWQ